MTDKQCDHKKLNDRFSLIKACQHLRDDIIAQGRGSSSGTLMALWSSDKLEGNHALAYESYIHSCISSIANHLINVCIIEGSEGLIGDNKLENKLTLEEGITMLGDKIENEIAFFLNSSENGSATIKSYTPKE